MSVTKRRRRFATTLVAAAGVAAAIVPASANAESVSNACRNNVTANNSQINVDTDGNSPVSVAPGDPITLTNLTQTANVPGSIFVAGYNLGLLQEGDNNIPAKVFTKIEGTNTVEGVQNTSLEDTTISTTITDPDHSPGTGDESATDGQFSVTYDDLTFTAGPSGVAEFRQDTQYPLAPSPEGAEQGTLIIRALVGGVFKVRFACSPGTVTPPDPGTVTPIDPAPTFTSTTIVPVVTTPTCFGVSGDDLNKIETANGTAYVSDGVTTTPNSGAKAGEQSFNGTSGDDVIIGTPGKDYVRAGAGNDKVCTLGGNDRALGEKGNDSVDGGDDNDGLYGGPNDDTLFGGAGDDAITGQKGNDALDGGAATDKCNGGEDTDTAVNCETLSNVP
jgi:Ca2+-binding RTX toxin-like protein